MAAQTSTQVLEETTGAKSAKEVLWVAGRCIDVSNFQNWHPGGDIIAHFIGRDSTTVFHATHPPKAMAWLKAREVPASAAPPPPPVSDQKLRESYMNLHRLFTERGWLTPSTKPLYKNLGIALLWFLLALFLPGNNGRLHPILLGILLGMSLHNLAFTVHDSMHGGIFPKKSTARAWCRVLGDLGFGVVGNHWDYEHVAHHVMSNCIDYDLQQRNSPLITVDWKQQTIKLDKAAVHESVQAWLLQVNHWFWLLAAWWGGRFALQTVGIVWCLENLKERWIHIVCLVIHYIWLVNLLSARSAPVIYGGCNLGPWFAGLLTVLTAGLLHIQLLVNHASQPMHAAQDDLRKHKDWIVWQTAATADIACHPWVDWFHGGLQFQITHHLFPRLRSDKLRDATPEVYAMLRDSNLEVQIYNGISGGIAAVSQQLVTACEAGGHSPWPPAKAQDISLQLPNIFWLSLHVYMFLLVPLSGATDTTFVNTFLMAFLIFVVLLFFPLPIHIAAKSKSI